MKKLVLPVAVLAMLALIGAAVALDCVLLAIAAREPAASADEQLQKQEQRLIELLEGSPRLSPETKAAIAAYRDATGWQARHAAYDKVVASFRQTMTEQVDPTNPLDRRFMDDTAGAINRREVAQKPFDDEVVAYREFLRSRRGGIARWFSPQARADGDDLAK